MIDPTQIPLDLNLARCAQTNLESLAKSVPGLEAHPFYILAKSQLDEALGMPFEQTLLARHTANAVLIHREPGTMQ